MQMSLITAKTRACLMKCNIKIWKYSSDSEQYKLLKSTNNNILLAHLKSNRGGVKNEY